MTKRSFSLIGLCLVVLLWFGYRLVWPTTSVGRACRVVALDVGQGDATLIRTPDGQDVLIDGGQNDIILDALDRNLPYGDADIELVVATHPDSDHIGGLSSVLEKYQVSTILETGVTSGTAVDRRWRSAIEAEHATQMAARSGQTLNVGADLTVQVLWPTDVWLASPGAKADGTNGTSVVLRAVCAGSSVLVTGDAPIDIEERLVESPADVRSSLLKLGHHGSKYSNSSAFIRAVDPQEAFISVGKNNRYGHPNLSVLERLRSFQIPVFRTDESGDIRFESDGRGGWRRERT